MEKDKIPFNYKMFRWACMSFWLVVIGTFLLLLGSGVAVFYAAQAAIYIFMILSAIGFALELKGWLKKVKEKNHGK